MTKPDSKTGLLSGEQKKGFFEGLKDFKEKFNKTIKGEQETDNKPYQSYNDEERTSNSTSNKR